MDAHSILSMDATSTAKAIKEGNLSCYDVVNAYREHTIQINPIINAMVEDRYEPAIREAREKDKQRDGADKGPLFGVPISVKEAFHVAGMKTTGGVVHRKHLVAREDAAVVRKLKEAGAIIIGKTNTPMLCFCQETDNKLYGRTNNPWDVTRTAGGSSGGEGALLGAGGAAAGIGSDIGGSIRLPSHFNGVVGFKPGKYQVSEEGHFPVHGHPLKERMSGVGPMGKSVRDIELMYQVMTDQPAQKHSLNNVEIAILPADTGIPLSPKTKGVLHMMERFLSQTLSVNRTVPPYFADSAQLWQEMMSVDGGKEMKQLAFNTDRPNVFASFTKEMLTKHTPVHLYLSWALIGAKLFQPSAARLSKIKAVMEQGDATLANYLSHRLLVFPVYHTGAPKHGNVYREIFSIRKTFLHYMPYVAYANVWGLPSLTIPVSTDENGLPIGVQIMSKNGNEDLLFQLGSMLEVHFRGYVRCTRSDA
ncbi:amidase [Lentibacillus lipolyticus]|nr:amidase [Lentibacillus lipolyticus]